MFKPLFLPRLRVPLVTTWALWRQLWPPSMHPLFKHRLPPLAPQRRALPTGCLALLLFSGMACGSMAALPFVALEANIPAFLPLVIFLASTVSVSLWAINTSVMIAQEREHGTYDLLCLAPSGPLGVHWALCSTSLRRRDSLIWIHVLRMLTAEGLLFIILVSAQNGNALDLLKAIILAGASFLDHIQATVLGCLVGMGVPAVVHSTAGARLGAALTFGGLQCGALLVMVLVLIPLARIMPDGFTALFSGLVIFFLLREGIVIVLWRSLARQFNTDPGRIDLVLG